MKNKRSVKKEQKFLAVYSDTKERFDFILFYMKRKGLVLNQDELISLGLDHISKAYLINERRNLDGISEKKI